MWCGKVRSRARYEEGAVQDANLQARPRKVSPNWLSVISAFSTHLPARQSALSIAPIFGALSRVLHPVVLLFFRHVVTDRVARHLHIHQGQIALCL